MGVMEAGMWKNVGYSRRYLVVLLVGVEKGGE